MDINERAHQPFCDETEKIWITYNGEISNYVELTKKYNLKSKYNFKTNSDTEVLIYLYRELGISFINELSGMFSFCLYDENKNTTYIVRDNFGITPLFYIKDKDYIYFASEIKALLEVDTIDKVLNHEAIFHLFTLAYIPEDLTPYQHIHELLPGTYLEINLSDKEVKTIDYFNLEDLEPKVAKKNPKRVKEAIVKSVQNNLRSCAPLGSTLSGGIDTSSIVGIASRTISRLSTFSIKIKEQSFDESYFQKMVSKQHSTKHTEVTVDLKSVKDNLFEHLAYMDEPYGHGAAIPSYLLAKSASREVKVLLSGEGGDELFCAYPTYKAYQYSKYLRLILPKVVTKLILKTIEILPVNLSKLSFDFKLKRLLNGLDLSVPSAHIYYRHVLDNKNKFYLFKNKFQHNHTDRLFENYYNKLKGKDTLYKLMLMDIRFFFVGDLMVKNDRMFLAHSVESRFPYMDKLLFDEVSQYKSSEKRSIFDNRYLQKSSIKDYVPSQIVKRQGFGLEMPYSKWFFNEDFKDLTNKYFSEDFFNKSKIFDYDFFKVLLKQHMNKKADHGRFLWTMLLFQCWYDLHFVSKNYKEYLKQTNL
jgi:asparagine synthase (glutamine-hydrolysing)